MSVQERTLLFVFYMLPIAPLFALGVMMICKGLVMKYGDIHRKMPADMAWRFENGCPTDEDRNYFKFQK